MVLYIMLAAPNRISVPMSTVFAQPNVPGRNAVLSEGRHSRNARDLYFFLFGGGKLNIANKYARFINVMLA